MIILGIDPGYDRVGIAIVEKNARKKEVVLYSTCIQTSKKDNIFIRFITIGKKVAEVIHNYKPGVLAIETLFVTNNQKTAMRVSEARGIIIYEALKAGLSVHEYSPMQIKSAITNDGRSDKDRIIKMIHLLVDIPKNKTVDDEYDAIAVALTHSAHSR